MTIRFKDKDALGLLGLARRCTKTPIIFLYKRICKTVPADDKEGDPFIRDIPIGSRWRDSGCDALRHFDRDAFSISRRIRQIEMCSVQSWVLGHGCECDPQVLRAYICSNTEGLIFGAAPVRSFQSQTVPKLHHERQ